MVALPPDTIHVKRKRGTDDANPVDFLRVERAKRSRSDDGRWVYQRKTADADARRASEQHAVRAASTGPPVIQPTSDGAEDLPLKASRPQPTAPILPSDTPRMRRFHLSRLDSPQPGVSKKRALPAVFVERDAKKHRDSLKAVIMGHKLNPTDLGAAAANTEPASPPAEKPAPLKRPGRGPRTTTPTSKPVQPLPVKGADLDELTHNLEAFAIDELAKDIARNLERIDRHDKTAKYSPATSRFKPKAPKLRYHERHPEVAAAAAAKAAAEATEKAMEVDVAVRGEDEKAEDEDDEYVIETYERVPIDKLEGEPVAAERIGLLVLDSAPDLDLFYGNESESEDEFPEDEEDENAENYYAADYPDDELDWEDEFNRQAYRYLHENAADDEEFDERDFVDEVWDECDKAAASKDAAAAAGFPRGLP